VTTSASTAEGAAAISATATSSPSSLLVVAALVLVRGPLVRGLVMIRSVMTSHPLVLGAVARQGHH
jgi:hypothetical protein